MGVGHDVAVAHGADRDDGPVQARHVPGVCVCVCVCVCDGPVQARHVPGVCVCVCARARERARV